MESLEQVDTVRVRTRDSCYQIYRSTCRVAKLNKHLVKEGEFGICKMTTVVSMSSYSCYRKCIFLNRVWFRNEIKNEHYMSTRANLLTEPFFTDLCAFV